MTALQVIKTDQFLLDLEAVVLFIAQDNVIAALDLEQHVHSQVDSLADPNFPRRLGRAPGTLELVVHPNYVVVLRQTDTTVTVLNLLHVARQYP
ncbi:type II toxin-antitoxin system RelE/ParE family toxin [Rhodoferax sp.]|uniref:type II toxin-antitoxin system RelE/ParE family toxin n=1 Tax=Rhodoferax sp. TaxID=50421 RepID=UPI002850BE73|nr:type II toxin-antitoxin system RelE/ParE family toxin [Rhodoferax sp.]MDR3371108.1 type II toxin-antitoxin system RelE/ParE family toxin [Rhodoferax sp.]